MSAEKKSSWQLLGQLFITFAKIGLFTFGGGYAMISLIENACVERKKWITHEEMMTVTVLAESTPGPIAINCATFVGYRQAGFWGAVAGTVGIVLPSFVILLAISLFLDRFLEFKLIAGAFRGIRLAVGLLILDAAVKMLVKMKKEPRPLLIMLLSAILLLAAELFAWNFSTIWLILAGAAVSVALYLCRKGRGEEKK